MQQIINFFLRYKNFLLFLLLFLIAISLTIQNHSYHRSKFINSANFFTGGIYESVNSIDQYFNLRSENQKLLEENNRLKAILFNTEDELKIEIDSTSARYILTTATVIKNSYSLSSNFLTINKGKEDSLKEDLGVITSKGIVGIIDKSSNGYSRVLSILHPNSRINAKLKKSDHFGELSWDGKSPEIVQLKDVQNQAPVVAGDTIITGGRSTIFPAGIPIGTVQNFELDESENYYTVDIKLFNDMTNIGHVHVVRNTDLLEIKSLENPNE